MTYQQHLETITRIGREYRYCKSIESLFELDQWTLLPARGVDYRQETAAFVARRKDELYLTDEAAAEEAYFEKVPLDEIEDPVERGVVRTFLQRRRVAARTPEDLQRQYSLVKTRCMQKWKEARAAKDYAIFMPWLKTAFDLKGQIARAIDPDAPAFDTLVSLTDAGLWGGIEGGFHEAISRFYENMVGRSRAYWDHCFPRLAAALPAYADLGADAFYLGLHRVHPSCKRIASDEVTYSLHAILRFELEQDYFAGRLTAGEMADAWNEKYREYLGVCPPDDTQGVLQDMHWAGDYIGYFQSYALGNIYDGQILAALERDMPAWQEEIRQGNFAPLNGWMGEHIWQWGCCFTAGELVQRVTGSALDAKPFLRYLDRKYSALYGLAPEPENAR